MSFKFAIAGIAIATLSGCSSISQKMAFSKFEKELNAGQEIKAQTHAEELAGFDVKTGKTDDLLWTLQAGAVSSSLYDYKRSNMLFDNAESIMRIEDTENALEKSSESVGSILGNDAMLDYEQTYVDSVMTNTYKAMNFWFIGKPNDARVEFNRADDRQRRAVNHYSEQITEQKQQAKENKLEKSLSNKSLAQEEDVMSTWSAYTGYVNPYTTYMQGLFLMNNAQDHSDYAKAADNFKRVYGMTKSAAVKVDLQQAEALAQGQKISSFNKSTWVIIENGKSAIREEKRIDLPVFLVTGKAKYVGFALPKIKDRGVAYPSIKVGNYSAQPIADLDKIIKADFKAQYPSILTRELIRASVKASAQVIAEKHDSSGLAGALLGLASLATTSADIRTWSALPSRYDIVRVPVNGSRLTLKMGTHTLDVKVNANANNLVIVKAWDANITPTSTVITM